MSTQDSENTKDKMVDEENSKKSSTTKNDAPKKSNVFPDTTDTFFLKLIRFLKRQLNK